MTGAHCSPAMDLVQSEKTLGIFKVLPVLVTLPGGYIIVNYLLFRSLKTLRSLVEHSEKMLESWEENLSAENRTLDAAELLETAAEIRQGIEKIEDWANKRLILRFLLNRAKGYSERLSDSAETLALSADPEMVTLGKELSDALRIAPKSGL